MFNIIIYLNNVTEHETAFTDYEIKKQAIFIIDY